MLVQVCISASDLVRLHQKWFLWVSGLSTPRLKDLTAQVTTVTIQHGHPRSYSQHIAGVFLFLFPCFTPLRCTFVFGICWTGRQIVCPFPGGMFACQSECICFTAARFSARKCGRTCSTYMPWNEGTVSGLVVLECPYQEKLRHTRPSVNGGPDTYCSLDDVKYNYMNWLFFIYKNTFPVFWLHYVDFRCFDGTM